MLTYQVELKSDVIVSADSNTEGFFKTLSYIPGSKFRGIAANKLFKKNNESDKEVASLFNGDIIFSNAYPFIKNHKFFPIPFSLFREKNSSDVNIYNFAIKSVSTSTEQIKSGFISNQKNHLPTYTQSFKLKTAYNREKGKSDDGKMFGYYTLPKGTTWYFDIFVKNNVSVDFDGIFVGENWIGKSKSAEFGWIEIRKDDSPDYNKKITIEPTQDITIYALSDLYLVDDYGNNTNRLKLSYLGFDEQLKIDFSKTFCKTSMISTWNNKRKNFDAGKNVIQKGSIITITNTTNSTLTLEKIATVGKNSSEGFGLVIINPDFLLYDKFLINQYSVEKKINYLEIDDEHLTVTHTYLDTIKLIDENNLYKEVQKFIKENKSLENISKSQWGAIKNKIYACDNNSDLKSKLFDGDRAFIETGKSKSDWNKSNNGKKLKEFLKLDDYHNEDYPTKILRFNILISILRLEN